MRTGILGTLAIGQAPRLDVVPIIDRRVPQRRRIHRGVLDGLSHATIAARYLAEPGEAALVTRLKDGRVVELSRSRTRDGAEQALERFEADGCDVILILCTGTFEGFRANGRGSSSPTTSSRPRSPAWWKSRSSASSKIDPI
jgi:protein AroM